MAIREINNVCRLCLGEELDSLISAKDVLDSSLTSEDVERFTNVKIPTDDNVPYVICTDCRNRLHKAVAFRWMCVQNDRLYRQLFAEVIDEIRNETKRQLNSIVQDQNHLKKTDPSEIEISSNDSVSTLSHIKQEQFVSCNEDLIEFDEATGAIIETNPLVAARVNKSKKTTRRKVVKKTKKLKIAKQEPSSDALQNQITTYADWKLMQKQLCNICGEMVTNIKRHVLSHTREVTYPCPHCSLQMTDSSNLVRHINAVHMKIIVKRCDECDVGFTHYNSYHAHMRSKHGIGDKYECNVCKKLFNHKSSMRDHMRRVHTFESKFGCKLCDKKFKTRRALRTHGRVHSDNTPYACSHCPKRFKSGYARNVHQLTHTGVTFACEICNKSYRYKSLLSIHMRKFHPEVAIESGNADQYREYNDVDYMDSANSC